MGLLWYTRERLGDCTFRVVFKTTTADDNSGIFIRIPRPVQSPWQAVNWGYEIQILGTGPGQRTTSGRSTRRPRATIGTRQGPSAP